MLLNQNVAGASPGTKKKRNPKEEKLVDAHYWLRSFDASRSKHKDACTEKRKRLISAGPSDVLTHFKGEALIGKKVFPPGTDSWVLSAQRFVEGKYKKLLEANADDKALSPAAIKRSIEKALHS